MNKTVQSINRSKLISCRGGYPSSSPPLVADTKPSPPQNSRTPPPCQTDHLEYQNNVLIIMRNVMNLHQITSSSTCDGNRRTGTYPLTDFEGDTPPPIMKKTKIEKIA